MTQFFLGGLVGGGFVIGNGERNALVTTQSIPFSAIHIAPSRQRQDFDPDALTDLANSISRNGLLHPPVMRASPSGPILVAGERRLRAMEQLWLTGQSIRHNGSIYPPETVPYVTLGDLSPLEAEEAELDENLKRKDLTWQEQSSAIARLHALRTAQAASIGSTQTIYKTLAEVSAAGGPSNFDEVRSSILLADHLDNPSISSAKSAKDAVKIIKRQEETQKNKELAERVGRNFNSSAHQLIHANCLEWLESCPDNSFDVILTDPPYGMSADGFGDGGGKLGNAEHGYDDSLASWTSLISALCPEIFRVAKPQSHAYIFCDLDNFHRLKSYMQEAGWYVFRTPIVVHKLDSGRVPLPEHGPRRTYELCLYAIKGKKTVTGIYPDVIPCRLEENLGHGANKPVELYTNLLRRSIRPGDTVLDCFAGTGTIFPAAHQCKVRAIGIELSAEYYGISVQRLNKLDEEPSLL